MTNDERELLAAEYVLGTLEGDRRGEVTRLLPSDGSLQRLVAQWEQRLGQLDLNEQPILPPRSLWARIEAKLDSQQASKTTAAVIRGENRPWLPLAPGVEWQLLHRDVAEGWQTTLVRFAPASRFAAHHHLATEECYVIEGELAIGEEVLRAGDYTCVPANSNHPEISSVTGALAYIRSEIWGQGASEYPFAGEAMP